MRGDVRLQVGEEFGVEDHAILDHLGQAAAEFPEGQGCQAVRLDPDPRRLVERADDVLRARVVHADLAPNRAVDRRQQAGRDHEQRQPSGIGRRDESRQVAHDAAAHRDHARMAIRFHRHQAVIEPRGLIERLGAFTRRQDLQAGRDPHRDQALDELARPPRQVFVRHDQRRPTPAARPARLQGLAGEPAERAGALAAHHADFIRPGTQLDAHFGRTRD